MRKLLICSLLIFAFALIAQSQNQEIEYGKPSELKGLTKIYIETMGNVADAERMTDRITKAKIPNLVIVENIKAAEMVLTFGGEGISRETGAIVNRVGNALYADTTRIKLFAGEGRVFVSSEDGKHTRLILRVQNEQETKLEKRPVTKFVNEFLKVYKKANDLK